MTVLWHEEKTRQIKLRVLQKGVLLPYEYPL
jgi:hypothetical protein